jgi:leucyl aminopeptidase
VPRPQFSVLPARRNIRISFRRARFDEASLRGFDACLVLCPRDNASTALRALPEASLWEQLHARHGNNVLVAPLGAKATPAAVVLFDPHASAFAHLTLLARAWKELCTTQSRRVVIAAEGAPAAVVEHAIAVILAGTARMPTFKSDAKVLPELAEISIHGIGGDINTDRLLATDAGNHLARWLTSLPPNVLNTASYTRALQQLAKREGWSYRHYSQAQLERLGAGAFLAVTRASGNTAGIVRLTYRPAKRQQRIALVGKGVCFDTGGINLKPHKSMYQMHEDMQGSAVAVGTLLALSDLRVPHEIDCWIALAENDIGPLAYRPQDVVTAVNGVTIQVVHSDAEGRMLLADTLALAAREKPAFIIDYATLTGACVGALTERYSGVFTNRADLHSLLVKAGQVSGERVWPFPMDEDFDRDLDTSMADILQCTMDGKGDHIFGARFLQRFVGRDIPWVHVDLSASSNKGGLAHIPTDFTGFGVRWTIETLLGQNLLQTLRA